jgi:hypothetical protein
VMTVGSYRQTLKPPVGGGIKKYGNDSFHQT